MPFRVTFFAAHAIICIIMVYLEKEEQILEFLHLNATFGRLEQHELHLHSGLNLICAPNESGKSTWGSFICAMLYGLSTRDRGLMADKNRFAPWSGAAMQGRMDILSDGRALTLQRDTRRANAPMGNFSCTYTGTGTPVEGITAQNAGEQLLGVPRDVWERSAFIGQNALAVSQSAELERRISSLITTGEEDASFTESYERLKKQLNRRKHNKTGQIPVLERDIAQLHQSLQELDALEQQARQAQEEVSALTQRVDGLRHQAAQQQAQIRQERINAWHRAARTAEEAQRRADILAEAAAPLPGRFIASAVLDALWARCEALLTDYRIDLIVLAGFLWKVPDAIIDAYPDRVINIHPALLPSYGGKGMYGMKVHEAVIAAGEKESGITIHHVNNHYDEGTTIFQAKCDIVPGDTPETLATKVHALEYEHFPRVIKDVLDNL